MERPARRGGPAERDLAPSVGRALRDGRRRLATSQRALAAVAQVPQSTICRLERGQPVSITLEEVGRLFDSLAVRLEVIARPPLVDGGPSVRDAVHARILGYVERHLRRAGLDTAREVPIGDGRVRGWIDLLAWRPPDRLVVVAEIKGDVVDIGALERQIAWYEREAWAAARSLGWRPARVIVAAFLLSTQRNAEVVRMEGEALRRRFPVPPTDLRAELVDDRRSVPPAVRSGTARRAATLAFVDPLRRGSSWLLPTPLFGGRPVLPYADARELRARLDSRRSSPGGSH
jgi:transcriptional regulator with XRE-family HTH domain